MTQKEKAIFRSAEMRIKDCFILRQIVGTWLVVPVGKRVVDFNGMITLSDTGAFLWKLMSQRDICEKELADEIVSEYDVAMETANLDVESFVQKLRNMGALMDTSEQRS